MSFRTEYLTKLAYKTAAHPPRVPLVADLIMTKADPGKLARNTCLPDYIRYVAWELEKKKAAYEAAEATSEVRT
jgi:hypothetical protein